MTVPVLSLSGLSSAEAEAAAAALVDIENPTGPDRLDRLLVLDDTEQVRNHAPAYQQLDTTNRVKSLLNVTAGPLMTVKDPRTGIESRKLLLPGNLGGITGRPTLWVGRLGGIDLELSGSLLVANRHAGYTPTPLDKHPLIGLLSVDEMFDRVYELLMGDVPGKVASPGLWLAGADDEAATFAGALAVAIRRVSEAGPGAAGPFHELLPDRAGGARLSESGPITRYLGRVREMDSEASHALGRATGFGGKLRRADGDARRFVVSVGEALADLRGLVLQMLTEGNVGTGDELTPNQHSFLRNAGLEFECERLTRPALGTAASAVAQSLAYRAITAAVRGGDSIPVVGKRLAATEREIQRQGSKSYVPEVRQRCPDDILARLANCPQKLPRYGNAAAARDDLGLTAAMQAAGSLEEFIIGVANREWSPAAVTPGELARTRAAIDGTRKALSEYAGDVGTSRAGARAARLASLGEYLLPKLRDLIAHVVAEEVGTPSASGPEALKVARERTEAKLKEWTKLVQAHGVAAPPPFLASSEHYAPYVMEEDVASMREAVLYPPRDEMWQLCGNMDLRALDANAPALVVRFASRLTRDALKGLPGGDPVWTSSGSFAGVLRLVQLRRGVADSSFGDAGLDDATDPSSPAGW